MPLHIETRNKHMKNTDETANEEAIPPLRRHSDRRALRRPPPPLDPPPPPPRRSAQAGDIRERLNCIVRRGRFDKPLNLTSVVATWAVDYVDQVFPQVGDRERNRLLLAAEAGFLASIEIGKGGIRQWERLLTD